MHIRTGYRWCWWLRNAALSYEMYRQLAGTVDASDEIVVRGERDSWEFAAFHVRDGAVRGAFAINRGREVRAAMKLIAAGVPVDRDALADPSTDLRKLVRARPTLAT